VAVQRTATPMAALPGGPTLIRFIVRAWTARGSQPGWTLLVRCCDVEAKLCVKRVACADETEASVARNAGPDGKRPVQSLI
jgi:hypothetical protein